MILSALVKRLHGASLRGNGSVEITGLTYDSRRVQPGNLFCALVGGSSNGNDFIPQALKNGALAVMTDKPDDVTADVPVVVVPDARVAMAYAAHELFDKPTQKLVLTGITGTNGKTTCTYVLQSILNAAGHKTGLIGTTGWSFAGEGEPLERTTPEAPDMLALLANMREKGATAAVLEVTSIAMPMHRVDGFHFAAGLFTNLSQDHLDLHGSMEQYFAAKTSFFEMLPADAVAVTNFDDENGKRALLNTRALTYRYGFNQDAEVRGTLVEESASGMTIRVDGPFGSFEMKTPYIGRFNASNVLGCATLALAMRIKVSAIQAGVANAPQVRGRMERLSLEGGVTAVIDYAHTPDALQRALEALRPLTSGKLIVVIGAGGNRDATKRPLMGKAAADGADVAVITSDNPRFEDPAGIVRQVASGAGEKAVVVVDRREAIKRALDLANSGDVLLIAGKGHETYQEIEGVKHPFDDREEVLKLRRAAC
ncbi:UDP-N-acetylmuramoyl-L-alanyl-D-glutamate--2,6-diaminopimelate ligase [bacterium]|nr:UDP-N-acetylmuramoyl-L-alanyl-D-glutamate--2,6-diaminopimelate ligase [bacterium]